MKKDYYIDVPIWPYADEKEREIVDDVLKSGCWWRNVGTQVKMFEKEFSEYHCCQGGVTVANGTVAIEIALRALSIKEGDEVIVPAFTFYSTVSAVLSIKAVPVIVDVLPDTFCIDPAQVKRALSDKTKAIIVVHMAGHMVDMDAVHDIAINNKLYVIEDAAHAHGAEYKGKKVGTLSDCSTFSFQNAKLMTAGEGGIILSNNNHVLHHAFLQANCGREEKDTNYQHTMIGTNARLSEFQGGILRVQLSRLNEQNQIREKNYQYLSELFDNILGIKLQTTKEEITVNPHYMIMFYYDKAYFHNASRDEFVLYLKSKGIPANRAYESIYKLPVFSFLDRSIWKVVGEEDREGYIHCENSERISDNVVCISHNVLLGDKKLIHNVVDVIREF